MHVKAKDTEATIHTLPKPPAVIRLMDGTEIEAEKVHYTEHGVKVYIDPIHLLRSTFYPYANIQWVQS